MTNLKLFRLNKNMDNISFQSRIRITNCDEFRRFAKKGFAQVNYPWSIKETVYSQKARTDGIYDCTALGITDGLKVLLLHICPTVSKNQDFNKLETQITEKIINMMNLDYLQGFILGSKKYNINSPRSTELFDMMEGLLKKLHIQYSKFKGGNYNNSIAYDSTKDEWIIGSDFLNTISSPKESLFETPQKAAKRIFDQVKIADCDELTW